MGIRLQCNPLWALRAQFFVYEHINLKRQVILPPSSQQIMITHSSILAWKISWTEEPGGLQPTGPKRSGTTE